MSDDSHFIPISKYTPKQQEYYTKVLLLGGSLRCYAEGQWPGGEYGMWTVVQIDAPETFHEALWYDSEFKEQAKRYFDTPEAAYRYFKKRLTLGVTP